LDCRPLVHSFVDGHLLILLHSIKLPVSWGKISCCSARRWSAVVWQSKIQSRPSFVSRSFMARQFHCL
jgi:hypothetical protein